MDYNLYSFGELQKKYKISKTLLEYLNIEIIKKGKASYITQESLDKVLKFKEENQNTRAILQKYTCNIVVFELLLNYKISDCRKTLFY